VDKHQYGTFRLLAAVIILGAVVLFIGCASVSIESTRDPGFSGKINRLFVLIKDNGQIKKSYSQNLQKALTERLSARGISSRVQIISPLELDDSRYSQDIKTFSPDAVLLIQPAGGTRRLQEIIEIFWDVGLRVPDSKTLIWRASIHMSGGSSLSRMTAMADGILSRMEQDGIITLATKVEQQQKSSGPPTAPELKEGGDGNK
jgi:hypothetical protein